MKQIKRIMVLSIITIILFSGNIYARLVVDADGRVTATPSGRIIGNTTSSSGSSTDTSASGIRSAADDFIQKGQKEDVMPISNVVSDLFPIGGAVQAVAILVLLVVGLIMGVKYMISGTDEKAKMKERLVWYVIAAVLVFGGTAVYNFVVQIINSTGI